GSTVSSGHRHTAEALSFLRDSGVTRDEVISTLGEPLIDSKSTRTLVFLWEEMPRYLFLRPSQAFSDHPSVGGSVEYGSAEQYALFVAYDEQGRIIDHEERYVDTTSLEE